MADRPLRPATRRCLGGPLPHQQADRPRAHPEAQKPFFTSTCEVVKVSGINPGFPGLSQSSGQVAHVLLTRSPLRHTVTYDQICVARLACIRHAASVRPEPGSNSPTYILFFSPYGLRLILSVISSHPSVVESESRFNWVPSFVTPGGFSARALMLCFRDAHRQADVRRGSACWFLARCSVVKEPGWCLRSGLRQAKSNLLALGLPWQIRSGGQVQSRSSNLTRSVRTLRALPIQNQLLVGERESE